MGRKTYLTWGFGIYHKLSGSELNNILVEVCSWSRCFVSPEWQLKQDTSLGRTIESDTSGYPNNPTEIETERNLFSLYNYYDRS
jgi:hypothetical protein